MTTAGPQDTFDYLIVGGGTAGCVLAERLSADPAVTVALVEAGGEGSSLLLRVPALLALSMGPKPARHDWAWGSVPQPGLNGRTVRQPAARVLGGASAVGDMLWDRGHPGDHDDWAALGNPGWSHADLLPYFLKAEGRGDPAGGDGPEGASLCVAAQRTDNPWQAICLDAARQAGFPVHDGTRQDQGGLGPCRILQTNGERESTARACLDPAAARRPNLSVWTRTRALRLRFDGKRATGVEVQRDGAAEVGMLTARREVLVCAGALLSPHLLQVSGVGDGAALQKTGIRLRHHLPGVGMNLQDTLGFGFGHRVPDARLFGLSPAGLWHAWQAACRYRCERRGPFAGSLVEVGGLLKLDGSASGRPEVQLQFRTALVDDHAHRWRLRHGVSLRVVPLRPASRGTVAAQGPDPREPPRIDPRYLDDPDDMERFVGAYRLGQRWLQAPALAERLGRDVFTAGVRSGLEIREVLRDRAESLGHFAGTCRMGADPLAVVDAHLRVHGLQGLRVVDASVMPTLVSGGLLATTVVLAEKAADLVQADAAR